jgi:hypothetical protein
VTVRAMAIGGWADGQLVEFKSGQQAYGYERLRTPTPEEIAAEWDRGPMATVTIRRTLYRLERIRFGQHEEEVFALAEGWTPRQAIAHLLREHRRVG